MAERDWNAHYAAGELPWDTGRPEPSLVELVQGGRLPTGRALEIGCGTGTDSRYLASVGYEVLGIDVAPLAIERARSIRADGADRCRFEVMDFLDTDHTPSFFTPPYDLVYDRGCFHVFDRAEDRAAFARRVAAILAPGGQWVSMIGSTEGPPRDEGPPRRSARDIVEAIEPVLEIVALRDVRFDLDRPEPPRAWLCVSGRREVPAQPSTVRY